MIAWRRKVPAYGMTVHAAFCIRLVLHRIGCSVSITYTYESKANYILSDRYARKRVMILSYRLN